MKAQDGSRWQLGHLNEPTDDLMGRTFKRGEVIATEGTSGSSTGYHLDLRADESQDPALRHLNKDPAAFWQRFEGSLGEPTAARQQERRVVVAFEGLDRIEVSGLDPHAAERLKASMRSVASVLSDSLTEVRSPVSHNGFG